MLSNGIAHFIVIVVDYVISPVDLVNAALRHTQKYYGYS